MVFSLYWERERKKSLQGMGECERGAQERTHTEGYELGLPHICYRITKKKSPFVDKIAFCSFHSHSFSVNTSESGHFMSIFGMCYNCTYCTLNGVFSINTLYSFICVPRAIISNYVTRLFFHPYLKHIHFMH